ncbi:DivIVA domain-containing protein [Micromonospora profundi]|uniref:DivIVA domain-containing protein n=1 Tax=Micromonospora profundi TaxID=1420889 RepID=UPI0036593D78
MGQLLLLLVVALTVAAVVFGVTVLISGRDPGLAPAEPDSQAVPLPGTRPLRESDVGAVRFDTALRGYRMAQVDQALRRAAYDIGYKSELIGVLESEVIALREGRTDDADALRQAREQAAAAVPGAADAGVDVPPADSTDTSPLPDATSSTADADGAAPAGGVTPPKDVTPANDTTSANDTTRTGDATPGDDVAPTSDVTPSTGNAAADGEPADDDRADSAGQRGTAVRSESA